MRDFKARPTTYCGIEMRSRLEARFAAKLDSIPAFRDWLYEPRAYADRKGQYLPDFVVRWHGKSDYTTYVEVKPTPAAALDFIESRRMDAIWASDPDGHFLVAYQADDRWEFLACTPEDREWVAL